MNIPAGFYKPVVPGIITTFILLTLGLISAFLTAMAGVLNASNPVANTLIFIYHASFLPAILLRLDGLNSFPPSASVVCVEFLYGYLLSAIVFGLANNRSHKNPQ